MEEFLRLIMEYFKDEDGSKMNIPSNFNHYAAGNAHEIIQKCYESSKITFVEILKTYDWDKNTGITNNLKKILEYATYPEKWKYSNIVWINYSRQWKTKPNPLWPGQEILWFGNRAWN